jgi:DNA-binding SARP family transcriptional activator
VTSAIRDCSTPGPRYLLSRRQSELTEYKVPSNVVDPVRADPGGGAERDAPATIFRILGPLEVVRGGNGLDLGSTKQRALLAMLLCRANSVVGAGSLIDVLWSDNPPRSAMKNLQSYASGLRRAVVCDDVACRLDHRPPGYQISIAPGGLDVLTFETLIRQGRLSLRSGEHEHAVTALRAALGLWRGPALQEFSAFPVLRDEVERLESRRLAGYEDLIEAELALDSAADLLEEIEDLSRVHPLRERLRSLQMQVLYRSGRQAESLAVFDEVRQGLARELGLSPSPALQQIYRTILSGGRGSGSARDFHEFGGSPAGLVARPAAWSRRPVSDLVHPFAGEAR